MLFAGLRRIICKFNDPEIKKNCFKYSDWFYKAVCTEAHICINTEQKVYCQYVIALCWLDMSSVHLLRQIIQ